MSEFERKPDGGLSAWIETYETMGGGENDAEILCLLLELRRRRENQAEAEAEIERRDAAAGEAFAYIDSSHLDQFGWGYVFKQPSPMRAGCKFPVYAAAPPAVLPPEKPVNTDLSRTDIMKNIAYNQALNDVKSLGAQPQKPVVIPDLPHDCDRTEAHFKYIAALEAANVPYEIKK